MKAEGTTTDRTITSERIYKPIARLLHWLVAALIVFQLTAGVIMVYEGPEGNVWERISNALHLYDTHKVMGLVILAFVLVRLAYRLINGAPPDEPTLETWQKEISHMLHAWIYLLLIALPVLGWLGISLYPAVRVYEAFNLPSLVSAPDKALSEHLFVVHKAVAFVLMGLLAMHIGAALYHHFIRGDGVLRRMLPGLPRKDG